ncbi:MAG: hypothetical protein CL868_04760 [Cytophagaceae bacterium]|nr:hypothetical protein [Cytophagaceae bacterium]|tara:strand:+ start:51 stop:599 length:549 start_codon:yes stop_codon:yes gene_type:complete
MKLRIIPFILFFCLVSISCVKDVDFDQADEIYLENEFETDLVYFTLNTSNFVDADSNAVVDTLVTQTTNLEFLDDDFIQENLVEIALELRYDNTFLQSFENEAVFLSRNNQELYNITFTVSGSPDGSVVTTQFKDTLRGAELERFKRSIKLKVSAAIEQDGDPIEGNLDFRSKAYYRFLFEQ